MSIIFFKEDLPEVIAFYKKVRARIMKRLEDKFGPERAKEIFETIKKRRGH
jgi:hypothetical protein